MQVPEEVMFSDVSVLLIGGGVEYVPSRGGSRVHPLGDLIRVLTSPQDQTRPRRGRSLGESTHSPSQGQSEFTGKVEVVTLEGPYQVKTWACHSKNALNHSANAAESFHFTQ